MLKVRTLFLLVNSCIQFFHRPIAVGAVVSTSIACCLILANIVHDGQKLQPATYPPLQFDSFFMAFGTICFAFGGHPAFPTFQTDMKEPEKFGRAIFIAYFSEQFGDISLFTVFKLTSSSCTLLHNVGIPDSPQNLSSLSYKSNLLMISLLATVLDLQYHLSLSVSASSTTHISSHHDVLQCFSFHYMSKELRLSISYSCV